jgi:cyanophycinase
LSLFALLGSGEWQPWTDEVDRLLLERTTGDGTVLILPTASAPEGDRVFDKWAGLGRDHFQEAGIPAEVVPLKSRADAERPELVEKVVRSSVVYFSGGNPAFVAETLAGTPFWDAILDGLDRGLAYAGCSAGIACLGDVAPDSTSNDPTSAHFWRPGLGLFPKLFFGPHWDALDVYVPGLRASIVAAIPHDCRLLAIDEDTAVVGDGTSWQVVGKGGASILEDGAWTAFPSGTSFTAHLEHHPPRR